MTVIPSFNARPARYLRRPRRGWGRFVAAITFGVLALAAGCGDHLTEGRSTPAYDYSPAHFSKCSATWGDWFGAQYYADSETPPPDPDVFAACAAACAEAGGGIRW